MIALLVGMLEDDWDDRYLTKETIAETGLNLDIRFHHNSDDFLADLLQNPPHLVLVDDNSTPENGLQVLRRIRQSKTLSHLPVVLISDSQVPEHRKDCYREGAASFIIKPRSLEATRNTISTFFRYWLEVAEC